MADRPTGDELDLLLRDVVAEIAEASTVPEELNELLAPHEHHVEVVDMLMRDEKRSGRWRVGLAVGAAAAVVLLVVGLVALVTGDDDAVVDDVATEVPEPAEVTADTSSEELVLPDFDVPGIPEPLRAAEAYAATPSADRLAAVIAAVGGLEAIELGRVSEAADIATFDPADTDRLLLSKRASPEASGDLADNSADNIVATFGNGEPSVQPFAPDIPHDSVEFNPDGTVTMWIIDDAAENPRGWAVPRATVLAADGSVLLGPTEPYLKVGWATDSGSLVVHLGDPVTPASATGAVLNVTADGATELPLGSELRNVGGTGVRPRGWLGVLESGLFYSSPTNRGPIRVWTTDGQERSDHPLAGLELRRVALAADAPVALGVTYDDTLVVIDAATGTIGTELGAFDAGNVPIPIAIDPTGEVAITVDADGVVTMWHLADEQAVFSVGSEIGRNRDLYSSTSTALASVPALDSSRLALRTLPGPEGITWRVYDTDVTSLLDRACALAGRSLTAEERSEVGFGDRVGVCD